MNERIETISNEFFNGFQSSHVLLYIGQSATVDEIKSVISKGRWSAIITTSRDPEFSSYFANDSRGLQTCVSNQMISTRCLSREKPLLIQLFGVDGELTEDDVLMSSSPFGQDNRRRRNAEHLLRSLPSLLDYVNTLVVTGIDSDEDVELLEQLGELLLDEVTPGSVSFWGMADAFPGRKDIKVWLQSICEKKSFRFYNESLATAIQYRVAEEKLDVGEMSSIDANGDVFFCNQKPVGICQDELMRIKNAGVLLTERTLYRVRPLGRSQQRMWFSNFLELSGIGEPQWYGYLTQSNFHVKREYEDALVQLVRRALRGHSIDEDAVDNRPIILSGDPGSSKSVTLGALAYRVYNEKLHPVVFVPGDMFLGNSYGSGFRNLIDSLEAIQNLSGNATSILVIWDGSSYREIESDAKKLLTQLKNRGRNVVLVCSSYSLGGNDGAANYYSFNNDGNTFERCSQPDDAVIVSRSGCLFVKANRSMSEHERYSFWQKASNFSGISEQQIRFLKKKMAEEVRADIFNHYYYLVSLLRERLEGGLEGEQDKVVRFLQEERPDCFKEIAKKRKSDWELNPMWQAFLKAGMTIEQIREIVGEEETPEGQDNWNERLVRANTYIALFSRYKIDVPYSFVYAVITNENNENPYGESGRELFDTLTTKIPWLSCGENNEEEFVFRFRNSLEADIFLDRHGVDGERLVRMAVESLTLYGESFRRDQHDNPRLAQKLQSLIRLMGPNSKFYGKGSFEHKCILAHLDELIDAIDKLLWDYKVPDDDCGFALLLVTLTREYYGKNVWNTLHNDSSGQKADYFSKGFTAEDYESRLQRLLRVSSIASSNEQALEEAISLGGKDGQSGYLRRQANGLVVEATRCNLEVDDLRSRYLECCSQTGQEPKKGLICSPQPYSVQFQKLASTIRRDPINGYAYNALFSLFEREYQSNRCLEDLKIEYLTEVMTFVDECVAYGSEIENRGAWRNELDEHVSKIASFADGIPASIDLIENDGQTLDNRDASVFVSIYNKFLQQGNPAAIMLICRKEINQLNDQEELSEAAAHRCRKVLDFMTERERFKCIGSDSNALAFLVRTAWMAFSKSRLSETKECRLTSLSQLQWRELHRYCRAYSQVVEVQPNLLQPLIILIYALSTLQIGGRDSASYGSAYTILQQIKEEQFYGQYRMKTPFIICNESGEPVRFTGTVRYTKGRSGYMNVNGLPFRLGNTEGVYFNQSSLGRNSTMPEVGEVLPGLVLGINYRGFTLYNEQGCKERGRR